ncbi:MAG: hypothetical protein GFH27_549283n15 [Chloroflexi bacterium AL-W]|nr:hypothetical protein [Chloroflexi bacterium AL-N1]NOK64865.1 hypothetical protein [Chloroflexi bacterium AL-N10]NOK76635.1 hypothetical protein [Chloroflexi bacterium AL-N5]NOK80136.1 hypothetical protein [Chloroflexi bacterium AL-W]NOK86649.1 hypothetical protein [Chloroflexi bacterium AL-N15]
MNKKIKINIDSEEEIQHLYNIGSSRAKEIVAYRTAHGFFSNAEDLAKVEGIHPLLARTLAPHIDWSSPLQSVLPLPKKRDWFDAFFWVVICLAMLAGILSISLVVSHPTIYTMVLDTTNGWMKALMIVIAVAILVCFLLFAVTRISTALSQCKERAQAFTRIGLLCMGGALSLGSFFLLGVLILSTEQSIYQAEHADVYLTGLVSFLFLFILTVPQLIVWRRPDLAQSSWLAGIFDTSIVLFGLMLLLGIQADMVFLPVWLLSISSFAGMILIIVAIISIRRGESFFQSTLDFIDMKALAKRAKTIDDWRHWLNIRLPDSNEQKELKSVLESMYPQSRGPTILHVSVFMIGSWIILTALGAIIELYVQSWWEALFK